MPLPGGVDPVAGAILGCAAMTAYGAVRRGADLRYGETVAVVATGGVGSNVIQIAKAFGARRIVAIDVNCIPILDSGKNLLTMTISTITMVIG